MTAVVAFKTEVIADSPEEACRIASETPVTTGNLLFIQPEKDQVPKVGVIVYDNLPKKHRA